MELWRLICPPVARRADERVNLANGDNAVIRDISPSLSSSLLLRSPRS
jgi:hypothetical protein